MSDQAVERLSAIFHEVYQKEAKRQGDVRHKDDYEDLAENVKDFDRALARYVLKNLKEVRRNCPYRDEVRSSAWIFCCIKIVAALLEGDIDE